MELYCKKQTERDAKSITVDEILQDPGVVRIFEGEAGGIPFIGVFIYYIAPTEDGVYVLRHCKVLMQSIGTLGPDGNEKRCFPGYEEKVQHLFQLANAVPGSKVVAVSIYDGRTARIPPARLKH